MSKRKKERWRDSEGSRERNSEGRREKRKDGKRERRDKLMMKITFTLGKVLFLRFHFFVQQKRN